MSKEHSLGDAPIQAKYEHNMTRLAQAIDRIFNGETSGSAREVGFVLLVFPFGDNTNNDRCNFISNGADRKDIVALFKEMIARFEGQPEVSGKA